MRETTEATNEERDDYQTESLPPLDLAQVGLDVEDDKQLWDLR